MIAAKGLHIKNLRKIFYKKQYKMLKFETFSAELQEFKVNLTLTLEKGKIYDGGAVNYGSGAADNSFK